MAWDGGLAGYEEQKFMGPMTLPYINMNIVAVCVLLCIALAIGFVVKEFIRDHAPSLYCRIRGKHNWGGAGWENHNSNPQECAEDQILDLWMCSTCGNRVQRLRHFRSPVPTDPPSDATSVEVDCHA